MLHVAKRLDEGNDFEPVLLRHGEQLGDVALREAVECARDLHGTAVREHVLVLDEQGVAAGPTNQGELRERGRISKGCEVLIRLICRPKIKSTMIYIDKHKDISGQN